MYDEEIKFARELSQKAGNIIKKNYKKVREFELKSDDSPVTVIDTKINQFVSESIRKKFPRDGFDGEEGGFGLKRIRKWLCDPIDGTALFNIGIPESTFLLSLYDGEKPVLAVGYNPVLGDNFEAVLGNGAFCNGERIHVSNLSAKDRGYVVVDPKIFIENPEIVPRLEQAGFKIVGMAATGQKFMIVAEGGAVATIRGTGDYHDIGVGAFLVQEAGGVATDLSGNKPAIKLINGKFTLNNGYIAGNPTAHKDILKAITD